MAQESNPSIENIARFFDHVRQDSGLQGQLLGEVAYAAPELLAKIAGEHGYRFSTDDLKQLLTNRAQRSVQGEVFWSMVLGKLPEARQRSFVQIKGPSWVNQAPYRKAAPANPEKTVTSLAELLREIESEAP